MKNLFLGCLLLFTAGFLDCSKKRYTDPLSPEEALKSFALQDGFRIDLFAAEPQVQDPVSMVFDEFGNIYVVEMPDYPYKPDPDAAKGRIRRLADTDGDGQIDQSTIFADHLSEATSVLPWRGGLLVTTAPHILYLKDTDGDHRADQREVLFTGFFENNSEAQITNLRFGIDNWIYAANFGQPGEVSFSRKPDRPPLSMQGGDFRFRLDRDQYELATGPTQFGQALDDWGHRFMSQNTIHLRQAVLPWRYLIRHPYLPSTAAVENISDHDLEMFQQTPPPYWRAERTRRRQQQYDEQNLDRVEYAEDHFTGASGATFYGGDAFPAEYYGNIFTGDVAGNLVHRDVLDAQVERPAYVAKRSANELDREFLTATDPWFRPANFTVGPDGNLYVIDMYRQHIETPVSIPDDLKADMDFYNGSDRGRIYRISPVNTSGRNADPLVSEKSTEALVALLEHPNQWHRLQAQRLLLERRDTATTAQLQLLFQQHQDPRTRLHALYVLEGLDQLSSALVERAMRDPHPGVREHGIILSERFPALLPQLIEKVNDPNARVALQASLSLGEFSGTGVTLALANTIEKWGENSWFRTAVLSSDAGSSPGLIQSLADKAYFSGATADHQLELLVDISRIIGQRQQEEAVEQTVDLLIQPVFAENAMIRNAVLKGLAEGLTKAEGAFSDRVRAKLGAVEAAPEVRELLDAALQ